MPGESGSVQLAAYAFDQAYQMLLSSFGSNGPWPKNTPASAAGLTDVNALLTALSERTEY